ncbi:MarR family transcriptional regulator [Arthrobacter sp. PM3]|uniref:MarR family transcriptional regulator n=1 Tax=Arthrobacter sp. PM3 TaxID=2017685 RepID=UPI000E10B720|nr:MarR family transcriptional regulator [Arthrobacter sp. PM3]AXJ10568.1 MarR family transcriptional regulator [Arthrobacter sp. PM3]
MYVMTIDQRGSTGDVDRVPAFLQELGALPAAGRFERSVGDEVQGVVAQAADVVEIALHALRSGRWYVGIGVGEVDLPLPASPREGSGPAFVAARAAVERAKAAAAHVPLAVVAGAAPRGRNSHGAGQAACANAEAVLRLIGRLIQERTPAQWKVVDMLRTVRHGQPGIHGTQKVAARKLGITEQSVSRAVLRSGWQEEWAARPAAEMLLSLACDATAPDTTGGDR